MTRHRDDPFLFAKLEATLPDPMVVGKGNALFVTGWCYHREHGISDLQIQAGDAAYPISTRSMPRADVFAAQDPEADPHGFRYRSGFWGFVPISPVDHPQEVSLELIATLSNREIATKRLADVRLEPEFAVSDGLPPKPARVQDEPPVAICMTTFNPRMDLFRRQIESLREQTYGNWVCVISDDLSRPHLYAQIREEVEDDPRFLVSQADRRLGYYRNFERVLGLVPAGAELVALCDQDDRWHPDKLEQLRSVIGSGVTMAYSDMNLVDEQGEQISPTYWTERHTNHTNMTSLLVANTITAAASMFPRRLLEEALPFPAALGHAFHDHWLAMVALASGRIAYVDRSLYDYTQHAANAFGSRGASWRERAVPHGARRRRRISRRARLSARLLRWRLDYFYNAVPARLHAEILMLRCDSSLAGRKRRAVQRMRKADRSLPLAAWLAVRSVGARPRRASTMGQERLIALRRWGRSG